MQCANLSKKNCSVIVLRNYTEAIIRWNQRGVNKEESDLDACKDDIELRQALHRRAASITFWRTTQRVFFPPFLSQITTWEMNIVQKIKGWVQVEQYSLCNSLNSSEGLKTPKARGENTPPRRHFYVLHFIDSEIQVQGSESAYVQTKIAG